MKRTTLLSAALVAALSSAEVSVNAFQQSQAAAIEKAVSATPILELVPKAAQLVKKADKKDRQAVAVATVRAVLAKRASLAPALVEAIAKVAPETTVAISKVATELCPEQAERIVAAAVIAAPEKAQEIAVNTAKIAPKAAIGITRRAIGAEPENAHKIVKAVIAAAPTAKAQIENDVTISYITAISRNIRSSASSPVRKVVVSTPSGNNEVIVEDDLDKENRSQAVIDATSEFKRLSDDNGAGLDNGQKSSLIVNSVGSINTINRSPDITKQEKNNFISLTTSTLKAAVTEDSLTGQAKTDLAKALVSAMAAVVADPNVSPVEKSIILNFINSAVTDLTSDTALTGSEVTGIASRIIEETRELQQKAAVQTDTQTQTSATESRAQVEAEEKAYGSAQ
jgi:hypothetical protein